MPVLRAHFFYTAEAASAFPAVAKRQVDKGTAFLKGKGANIVIESYPKGGGGTAITGIGGNVNPNIGSGGLAQYLKLRDQCHAAEPNPTPPRVPVIFLTFSSTNDAGQTVQKAANQTWLPFILIDVGKANQDGLTLLHEMGHCCGLQHPGLPTVGSADKLDASEADNFMGYGNPKSDDKGFIPGQFHDRGGCYPWQVTALRTAYFYGA